MHTTFEWDEHWLEILNECKLLNYVFSRKEEIRHVFFLGTEKIYIVFYVNLLHSLSQLYSPLKTFLIILNGLRFTSLFFNNLKAFYHSNKIHQILSSFFIKIFLSRPYNYSVHLKLKWAFLENIVLASGVENWIVHLFVLPVS